MLDSFKAKKVFCSGIGGAGLSALARILKHQGVSIGGSDNQSSEIIDQLRQEGITVLVPQTPENIGSDIDIFIHSVAIDNNNPEKRRAEELGLEILTYPQALGRLIDGQYGIGVSGTNGKTTTTAMLGQIFVEAGLDPTVVVGSKVAYLGGNSRVGAGQDFIFESDEYRRAFDCYRPQIAVVTYITADHLDYYQDLAEIKVAFDSYLARVPQDGLIVINADDPNSVALAADKQAKVVSFGIDQPADFSARQIRVGSGRQLFAVYQGNQLLGEISLIVPAKYNIYNALAAIAVAYLRGVDFSVIKKTLEQFKGAWRRFEFLGQLANAEVIVDYAHTPDALEKTIAAAKEFYPQQRLLVVFQPHQFSRTKALFKDFAQALAGAAPSVVVDIFYVAGRERPQDFDINSKKLAVAANQLGGQCQYGGDLIQTEKTIRQQAEKFDIILVMGAGDIYRLAKNLINK